LSTNTPKVFDTFTLDITDAEPFAVVKFYLLGFQAPIGTRTADVNGVASLPFSIDNDNAIGASVTFEAIEDSTGAVSNQETAVLQSPDYTLDVIGSVAAGGSIQLEASYGTPNTNQYFFYSLNGPGNGKANIAIGTGNYDIDTGLTNPVAFMATPMKTSDSNGYTLTATQGIPGNAAGLSVWFSVIDAAAYNAAPYARTGEFVVQ